MDRIRTVQKALEYIEENLIKIEDPTEVAKKLHVPYTDLQNSFAVIVGYSLTEYIRNRRLYEAARELASSDAKIIDVSYKYGYESPDSFSKAFYRFHGVLPSKLGRAGNNGKVFRPITVDISVNGGVETRYRIDRRYAFKMIGFQISVSDKSVEKAWEEFFRKYSSLILMEHEPQNDIEYAVAENSIGEYGIYDPEKEVYLIAGRYVGGTVPPQLTLREFETSSWAVYEQRGLITHETINNTTKMMLEDISANGRYRIKRPVRLEKYEPTVRNLADDNEHCLIQLPVEQIATGGIICLVRVANMISIILLLFALVMGGREYRIKSEKQFDSGVLCSLAQYSFENDDTEEGRE